MFPREQNQKPGYKIRKTEDTKSLTSRPNKWNIKAHLANKL